MTAKATEHRRRKDAARRKSERVMYCSHCGVMLTKLVHGQWQHPATPCDAMTTKASDGARSDGQGAG